MNQLSDKYEIIEEIASGELNKVFKARHLYLDRFILLKILHKKFIEETDICERFRREAKIAASIDHPNVVRVYDCGDANGQPYIALEWVHGENLYEYLLHVLRSKDMAGTVGKIPLSDIFTIAASILKGLSAIHSAGVVHRDLKPENVMIDTTGLVKLTDFSLSLSGRMPRLTQHGDLIGSPGYMAPEVIAGEPPTTQSDLFAAGLILWELLTGINPFVSADIFTTLQNVQEARLPDIEPLRPGLPKELKTLRLQMLSKNPAERPASAEQALEILTQVPGYPGEGIRRSQSGLRIPSPPLVRRKIQYPHKAPYIAFAALIVVALFVSYYFWTHQGISLFPLFANNEAVSEIPANSSPDTAALTPQKSDTSAAYKENNPVLKSGNTSPISKISETPVDKPPAAEPVKKEEPSLAEIKNPPPETKKEPIQPARKLTKTGYLNFVINPWARIYIDGSLKGDSPLNYPVEADTGEHWIVLDNPYFPRLDFNYRVFSADTTQVNIDIFDHISAVSFDIQPWGYIYLNDKEMGVSPLPRPLYLKPGEYDIRIEHPKYPGYKRKLHILPGENISIVVDLTTPSENPAATIDK